MKSKRFFWALIALLIVSSLILGACGGTEEPVQVVDEPVVVEEDVFLACEVTDVGGIDDKSFNATAWKGMEDAVADLGIEAKYLES
ncbi:MAG TPA: BMP family ABC transporter substrate-binding protein, partial [Chloroflexi bacterium]|nr:BMP family ABC transporter substrate-binding protein [Chloroflexota bacterium]